MYRDDYPQHGRTQETTMALDFAGIDPESKSGGSPTVWIEDDANELVIQGWKAGAALEARIHGTEWVPGHKRGIPEHETVVRIPLRMVPILRKACDDAERAGLFRPVEGSTADGRPSGDA
ncbi:hypothetical protein [Kitasatospora purpeofusca]|uniref:hypothetical protein n=1 Tax=Kitasatospora purpeofusca TaxID=67352 RepID=UPI0038689E80